MKNGMLLGLAIFLSAQSFSAALTSLSVDEKTEVKSRLDRFYANPSNPDAMNERQPKFGIYENKFIHPKSFLKLSEPQKNPLKNLAQKKATQAFWKHNCNELGKKSASLNCNKPQEPQWATIESNDKVRNLVQTWMTKAEVQTDLSAIPIKGTVTKALWSDDYWRTQYGGLSYRYETQEDYKHYQDAIKTYQQPQAYQTIIDDLSPTRLQATVVDWSPAEKYDLTVEDPTFSFTNQQKEAGKSELNDENDVEDWMGICDGWTAASIMVPRPIKPVTVVGLEGLKVEWYPADIRALASESWSVGDIETNFIGGRCDSQKMEIYGNGRLVQQECFDTNPATFHLALGNMIGIKKLPFAMDKSFDYEVWNQPIQSYEFSYFNPTDRTKTSSDWKTVAVDYNDDFKEKDRFQRPMTRGKRIADEKWDDSDIKKIVGVVATVVYLDETSPPDHKATEPKEELVREVYTYDLELAEKNGKLVPTGGEWFQNAHPDFLWVPRKGTIANSSYDKSPVEFNGDGDLENATIRKAKAASRDGYPLCDVVKNLVGKSSGDNSYPCR